VFLAMALVAMVGTAQAKFIITDAECTADDGMVWTQADYDAQLTGMISTMRHNGVDQFAAEVVFTHLFETIAVIVESGNYCMTVQKTKQLDHLNRVTFGGNMEDFHKEEEDWMAKMEFMYTYDEVWETEPGTGSRRLQSTKRDVLWDSAWYRDIYSKLGSSGQTLYCCETGGQCFAYPPAAQLACVNCQTAINTGQAGKCFGSKIYEPGMYEERSWSDNAKCWRARYYAYLITTDVDYTGMTATALKNYFPYLWDLGAIVGNSYCDGCPRGLLSLFGWKGYVCNMLTCGSTTCQG